MIDFLKENQVTIYAILGGLLPAIFWLWFWLYQEDSDDPEPKGLILLSFILGGIIVLLAIWLEKYSLNFIQNKKIQIIAWSTIEELLKFAGVALIIFQTNVIRKPIDYPMYFIAVGLGFAALENIFYLLDPSAVNISIVSVLTGNLRFLGSTLLHAISSSMIGSAIGLAWFMSKWKNVYLFWGIVCAIVLHSLFNFFIMKGSGENFLSVFAFLWVVAIINILVFEKLKRMGNDVPMVQYNPS
jgi:RsiW-degrading membrane proteinase PrsW (M82 family)